MRGIILAGGENTRMYPMNKYINKCLLPVGGVPAIYHSICLMMRLGIREICIVSDWENTHNFFNLLGKGYEWGIHITYQIQDRPKGIVDALYTTKDFIKDQKCCVLLGDNIFSGFGDNDIKKLRSFKKGAYVVLKHHANPKEFGVATIDENNNIISIIEKPKKTKSNKVVTGLYFYDSGLYDLLVDWNGALKSISDVNNCYQNAKQLRGFEFPYILWDDIGTLTGFHNAQIDSYNYPKNCPEVIAYENGYISKEKLMKLISTYPQCQYKEILKNWLRDEKLLTNDLG